MAVTNDTLEENEGTVVVVVGMVVVRCGGRHRVGRHRELGSCLLVATAPELHPATNAAMRNSRTVHPEGRR